MRARRPGRAGRKAGAVVAMLASVLVLVVQPTPARADTYATDFFPYHWGPNPYFTLPADHVFYRSVYLIDNTGDPSLSQQISTFVQIVNSLHFSYNGRYPVVLYYKDFYMAPGQPCAAGPEQFLVVCKDEALVGGSPTAPGLATLLFEANNHIFSGVARFRPSKVDTWCAGDKFTLTVQLISNTLGLDQNLSNPASAMHPTIPVGRCTYNGWVGADLERMNQLYSHAVG